MARFTLNALVPLTQSVVNACGSCRGVDYRTCPAAADTLASYEQEGIRELFHIPGRELRAGRQRLVDK